jgi:hypothetical protein
MAGLYASNGTINVNVVPGTSFVGRQAANGGLNVFQVTGTSFVGYQHVSGAINVFNAVGGEEKDQHPSGALLVTNSGKHNTKGVTVLTGVLT